MSNRRSILATLEDIEASVVSKRLSVSPQKTEGPSMRYKIVESINTEYFIDKPIRQFSSVIRKIEGTEDYYANRYSGKFIGKINVTKLDVAGIEHGYITQTLHDRVVGVINEALEVGNKDPIYRLEYNEAISTLEYQEFTPLNLLVNIVVLDDTPEVLPYGVYTIGVSQKFGVYLKAHKMGKLPTDFIIPNKNLSKMVKDFFLNPKVGRRNKQGYLLYGRPGNGKSSEIYQLMSICEELKMNVLIMESDTNLRYLEEFRDKLQEGRTVIVFEEMTERLHSSSIEQILSFMDGEFSWDNTITIATTNYPELFPANLIDRPGRFEVFIEYGDPTLEQIVELGAKFGFTEEQSSRLSRLDLSFDYISFIFSKAKELGIEPIEAKRSEEEKRGKLSQTFKGRIGLGV